MRIRWMGTLLRGALWLGGSALLLLALALTWLRIESHAPKDQHLDARQGALLRTTISATSTADGRLNETLELHSDSGLRVFARVLRTPDATTAPVLIIVGGHRTGQDAVDLFGNVHDYAVVALDYPYTGPQRIRGIRQTLGAVPLARTAFLDTPPAVSLTLDWLDKQNWAQTPRLLIGASLGVPFAAKSAARDSRIDGVILVHGAADNERWLTVQVSRRVETEFLHRPLGTLLHWLAYGPTFDTAENVARIAPRPVLIIGADNDERTPADEVEKLYAAANTPKRLRWTHGKHVEPGRTDVIKQMIRIATEEQPFLLAPSN